MTIVLSGLSKTIAQDAWVAKAYYLAQPSGHVTRAIFVAGVWSAQPQATNDRVNQPRQTSRREPRHKYDSHVG